MGLHNPGQTSPTTRRTEAPPKQNCTRGDESKQLFLQPHCPTVPPKHLVMSGPRAGSWVSQRRLVDGRFRDPTQYRPGVLPLQRDRQGLVQAVRFLRHRFPCPQSQRRSQLFPGPYCGRGPATASLHNQRDELKPLSLANRPGVQMRGFAGFIVRGWAVRSHSNSRMAAWTKPHRHCQVKGRRPVHAPARDPNIGRSPSTGGADTIFREASIVQAGRQQPRLLKLGAEASGLRPRG